MWWGGLVRSTVFRSRLRRWCNMLELLIVIMLVLWLTGTWVFPVGSAVHILLVFVLILIFVRLVPPARWR